MGGHGEYTVRQLPSHGRAVKKGRSHKAGPRELARAYRRQIRDDDGGDHRVDREIEREQPGDGKRERRRDGGSRRQLNGRQGRERDQ